MFYKKYRGWVVVSHLLTFTVAYLTQKHPDSSQLYDDTMHVYFTRDVCTVYILHLHTSYLLTLVAVVEHMVGFRTIACLSLGLVIFLVFFSPTTHMMLNWVSLNTTTSLVHFDIVSIICCFLLFFVCFLYFNVLSLIHMLEFWLPNPETLIF